MTGPDTPAKSRPIFVLRLRPEPRVDAVKALRALLKIALRRCGLRCLSVEESPPSFADVADHFIAPAEDLERDSRGGAP